MTVELATAAEHPFRFQPHPEIWLLIAGIAAMAIYAVRVIGPRATNDDEVIATRSQKVWFTIALLTLWLAIDWPMHDIAEEYLYFVHMIQHLLLSFVIPPMFLMAIPTWLARTVVGSGRGYRVLKWATRVIPATLFFNIVVVFSHWPAVVNGVVTHGWLHYSLHVLVVLSAFLMWMPVCGPLPELRFPLGAQMPYLFLQSIIPTVPAGWLTFADAVIYKSYDKTYRLWGISAVDDQQLAGTIMKVGGSTYLWTIITVLFFRFVAQSEHNDRARGVPLDRRAPAEAVLTWDEVERELATAPPAPPER
ncbi:MAG: putative rane protein [Actinomycetota bacterium]|nr:putative rane protein [Actinomycetota bacterium]